jgi:hypothetical protein
LPWWWASLSAIGGDPFQELIWHPEIRKQWRKAMFQKRMALLAGVAGLLALTVLPAVAQEGSNMARVYVTVPKPGMTKQYEEGRKRHMEWHRKQNDAWTWEIWQVITGEGTGAYLSISSGHSWKDFDDWDQKLEEGDTADGAVNMQPYLAATTASIWEYLPKVSRPPEGNVPSKMSEVIHFMVKPEAESDFNDAMAKINDAINKTNWPSHYLFYALENGGEGPHIALVLPHNNWADMAEPDVSFTAMLEKGLGRHDAEAVLRTLNKSVRRQWTEMLVYRPDLSYRPAAK